MKHETVEIIMQATKETNSSAYILKTKHKKIINIQELIRCKNCMCAEERYDIKNIIFCKKNKLFWEKDSFCSKAERIL